jgi:uncharacterized protein (TIGR00730 family)
MTERNEHTARPGRERQPAQPGATPDQTAPAGPGARPAAPAASGGFAASGSPEPAPTMRGIDAVAVYCGSSAGDDPAFARAADSVGRILAEHGVTLVYGGGSVGLMRRVADAALAAGGRVHGVITRELADREIAHPDLTELEIVDTMAQRKARMSALADAFLALPGGSGTLEEIFEQWTWSQIGLHDKPCAFLDVNGYYTPLRAFLGSAVDHGFIRAAYVDTLRFASTVAEALAGFRAFVAPERKWARSGRSGEQVLRIAALVLNDPDGRTLLVRKRGTSGFMQCGGKLEPGETPRQALVREAAEELGLRLDPDAVEHLGRFRAVALNEPDTHVDADAFFLAADRAVCAGLQPDREIAELVWLDPVTTVTGGEPEVEIAPLSAETLMPIAAARAARARRARADVTRA